MTVSDAAKQRGYVIYDCALPQPWVDYAVKEYRFDVRGHVVWCYDTARIFGEPAAVSTDGDFMLRHMKEYGLYPKRVPA